MAIFCLKRIADPVVKLFVSLHIKSTALGAEIIVGV
jgi:hypothetical protein